MGDRLEQVTNYFLGKFVGRERAENLFSKIKIDPLQALMLNLFLVVEDMMKVSEAVTHEFKFWFKEKEKQKCCLYVRPASKKFDIYLASLTEEQINNKAATQGLALDVSYDTNNKNDQFHAKITVSAEWLDGHADDQLLFLLFIKQLLQELPDQSK